VQEVEGRTLREYLALPTDEYNLLDTGLVERLGGNRFKVTFPFKEWFRINLTPEVILNIHPQPEFSRVRPQVAVAQFRVLVRYLLALMLNIQ
jgi:hypothetical protein